MAGASVDNHASRSSRCQASKPRRTSSTFSCDIARAVSPGRSNAANRNRRRADCLLRQAPQPRPTTRRTEPELADTAARAQQGLRDALDAVEGTAARWEDARRQHVYLLGFAEHVDGQDVPTLNALRDVLSGIDAIKLVTENRGPGASDPIPLPVPSEKLLAWRRDRRAQVESEPSRLTAL